MKDALKDEIKAYVAERVKKELNHDHELENLQQYVARWIGAAPDHFEDHSALQLWTYCDASLQDKLGRKFADYFFNQLKKRV